jgi:AcrR family transcriptional regulator
MAKQLRTGLDVSEDEGPPGPIFRRAKPEDAVDLAEATFGRGERVDMRALAAQLGVAPATMTRWFGTRGQLIDRVLERIATSVVATARAEAEGTGNDFVCDVVRRVMEATAQSEPLRSLVRREPQLALRVMLAEGRPVHRILTEELRALLRETRGADEAERLDSSVDAMVVVGTTLLWETYSVGDLPRVESAVEIIRLILESNHDPS